MATHVKVLGILAIMWGSALVAIGLFVGLLAGRFAPELATRSAGAVAYGVLLALGAPAVVAGVGLLYHRPWARILAIVVLAISLLKFPYGTLLGIYGLWVLLSKEGENLFLFAPWEHPPD